MNLNTIIYFAYHIFLEEYNEIKGKTILSSLINKNVISYEEKQNVSQITV